MIKDNFFNNDSNNWTSIWERRKEGRKEGRNEGGKERREGGKKGGEKEGGREIILICNLYLAPYTIIYLKWITSLSIKAKTLKLLEENIGKNLVTWVRQRFLKQGTKFT